MSRRTTTENVFQKVEPLNFGGPFRPKTLNISKSGRPREEARCRARMWRRQLDEFSLCRTQVLAVSRVLADLVHVVRSGGQRRQSSWCVQSCPPSRHWPSSRTAGRGLRRRRSWCVQSVCGERLGAVRRRLHGQLHRQLGRIHDHQTGLRPYNGRQRSAGNVVLLKPGPQQQQCCRFSDNIQATFDFIEATFDFVAFDNVASTLLLVWTGLSSLISREEMHATMGNNLLTVSLGLLSRTSTRTNVLVVFIINF